MKRIAFVIGNYKNGGVARRATNLANEMAKQGYITTILATREIGQEDYFSHEAGTRLVSLKAYCAENPTAVRASQAETHRDCRHRKHLRYISRCIPLWDKRLQKEIAGIRRAEQLRVFLQQDGCDIAVAFGVELFRDVYYAARGLRCKVVFAEKNASQLEVAKDADSIRYARWLLRRADGAVFQTFDEQAFYKGSLCKHSAVIRNPVKSGLPPRYTGTRRHVIVNFCRVNAQKNLPLLIAAFQKLLPDYPDYQLHIYGNTVTEDEKAIYKNLEAQINAEGLQERVKLLPPAANVHEQIADAAMFVSSSDFEGLSNSMLEAMAMGLPCVCTDCLGGGAREMIEDGMNGVLVPRQDATALYQGMRRMICDAALAERCAQNAEKCRTELSASGIAAQWTAFLEAI